MTKKRQQMMMTPEALKLVAARFKVLSDPMRLNILRTLEEGEKSVSGITETVESTQPNISKHLKSLQDAGFVNRRQDGNTVYYSIADESVYELCDLVCSSIHERLKSQASVFAGERKFKA